MGNIGSQSGHLKYKPTNTENIQHPHSFPRTQTRFQQDQLKVLPERTPKIRLRHTENGEILQTGGTLTGRQIQSKFGEARTIKKCGSEPHLHSLVNSQQSNSFELDRDRKFRKKYRAPPPPSQPGKSNENSTDYWEHKKSTPPKPRLFKTKIQTERKRSVPDYQEKSDYFEMPHRSLQDEASQEREKHSHPPPSHRLSLPALNTPAWDFQGELKEATRRLRKIRCDENNEFFSTSENNLFDATKRNKLKTLDHHIDRRDLIKLKSTNVIKNDILPSFIRSEASGKESSIEEPPPQPNKEKKSEAPKPFYFGMSSMHESTSSPKIINSTSTKFRERNYPDSDSSIDLKHNTYDSDADVELKTILPKKLEELQRFSPITKWKRSSSAESVMHSVPSKEYKYSSEENDESPRIFSIFPVRSRSNDRSGDSGISGDGSPAVYEDTSDNMNKPRNKSQSIQSTIPGWTPQQDLGDDSSFEEESLSIGDYNETFENQSNQHVFSLSLPREHHLSPYESSNQNTNETNFEKIRRSVSGILNTINRKEAESTPENEKGNWFLNKSCTAINTNDIQMKYAQISDELDEFLTRNSKRNTGRVIYLPKPDKHIRPKRYEARNKPKSVKTDQIDIGYINSENINENKSISIPENLQDSPIMSERKIFKKKPKRFTFQSTIRQIERRRIAEKLSREAERKEQQRLRELEVMQKVEKEFQEKRAREKVNIKQQLSQYSYENSRAISPSIKTNVITPVRELLHARSEPDGAVSSSPTSSLNQSDNKQQQTKLFKKNYMDFVNNNSEYKSCSDVSDDNRSKSIMHTQVLSEYRQPQREYRDYQSNKKHVSERVDNKRQTTIHPKVTYKMPKSKGMSRSGSNNYRKDFACGIRTKSESSRSQQQVQTKSSPNKYYSQFGPLTRF